ncbi:MAG TPA: glycosyltransferase family 4 protein [Steroidobacteraceae bacterium]|nr:glycosyltransferase family 4 protein [Steroidobacteraceae bacterium]
MNADSDGEVAYLLTEMPDRVEAFAAEVQQLSLTGVKLHVFSLVPRTELTVLEAFAAAAIPLTCMPRLTGPSAALSAPVAVRRLAALSALHLRLLHRRTRAYFATLAAVASMSWKSRSNPSRQRELVEDFLLAVEIAARVLDAGTVRHVHGYEGNRTSTRAWLVSRLTGLSFSFTAVTSALPDAELERALLEQKLAASRFVATRSDAARKRLTQAFPEAGAVHTVYHGVNTQYFSPRPAPQGSSVPVILSVGRFEESSGFEYLIAACAQLKAAGTACCCWLVGPEGAQSGAVLHAIETLGVSDRVSTHGSVTPTQLRHLLRHASVFALPRVQLADREYLPEGLAEAMAMGIPVVSTADGIITEVLEHRRNGVLLGDRDSKALARVLQALLQSAALRRRLGESGRLRARQALDIRVTAALLKTLFHTFAPGAATTPEAAGEDGFAPPRQLCPVAKLEPRRERLVQTSSVAHGDSAPSGAVPVG